MIALPSVCRDHRPAYVALMALVMLFAQPAFAQEKSPEQLLKEKAAEVRAGWKRTPRPANAEIDRIVKAWKDRAAKIETARITWTLTRTDQAGSFNGVPAMNIQGAGKWPAKDTTIHVDYELLYKDGQVRLEQHGQEWLAGVEHPVDKHEVFAYGLKTLKHLGPPTDPQIGPLIGSISSTETVMHLTSVDLAPLAATLAPFDDRLAEWSREGQWERVPAEDDAQGLCMHIHPFGTYVWVSRTSPEQLLRFQSRRRDGSLSADLAASWQVVQGVGLVPKSWVLTEFDPSGGIERVKDAKVTSIAFNMPLTPADLDVVFPAGTPVIDHDRLVNLVADGKGGLIPATGRSGRQARLGTSSVLGVALLASSLLISVFVWLKRRRRGFLTGPLAKAH